MRLLILLFLACLLAFSGCAEKPAKPEKVKPAKPAKPEKPKPVKTPKIEKPAKSAQKFGVWEQLSGMDGGDMHFIYNANGMLFASHGFGGVWYSEDGGKSWKIINQEGFVDLHFYDMEEIGGKIYAASNKGLWYSKDGKNWVKVKTGFDEVDSGRYNVVSLASYGNKLLFTTVLDKEYRRGRAGDGKLFLLENGAVKELTVPENREIVVETKYPYIFLSSPYSGLYVSQNGKDWEKILDAKTTKVFVDDEYNIYVGTIGEWWYIGEKSGDRWGWKQIKLGNANTIFHFVVPDPVNKKRLWLGCGGISTFYSFSARGTGNAFIAVGCWDGKKLSDVHMSSNYATSIAFYGDETVETECGKATKYAFRTVGGQAVQKTDDGGISWYNSYEGIYGDTINAISPIKSGILAGSIVVTAVSGTEIALDNGDRWMEIDFRIGKVEGKLPGYSWCAASPNEKIKGKYDLLISTGYPSPFGGDGVFGVDTACLKSGGVNCIERLIEGPHYEMVVIDDKLYAGNMDDGVDVLDLKTFKREKIEVGAGVPLVRMFDGKLFLGTYRGKYVGDGWRWSGRDGEVYVYDGKLKLVYDGYVINFFVRNGEFIALTQKSLVYKPDFLSGEIVEVELPNKKYTDMAVDWDHGFIFVSTDGEGVFYTTIDELRAGKVQLRELNDGLLTMKIRNIVYNDGYLFAGTRGYSVWRIKIG